MPLADGVADRMLIVNVLHHVDDDPGALAEIGRLLAPGGLLVAAEFAQMDRPVGPPNDHVLSLDEVRSRADARRLSACPATSAGRDVRDARVDVGRYHNVIVAGEARRP